LRDFFPDLLLPFFADVAEGVLEALAGALLLNPEFAGLLFVTALPPVGFFFPLVVFGRFLRDATFVLEFFGAGFA